MTLQADDIDVGMYITVTQGREYDASTSLFGGIFGVQTAAEPQVRHDCSYNGNVLRVKAISLPFIVVERLTGRHGCPYLATTLTLDIREVVLSRLTDEFVAAVLPEGDP